MNKHLRALGMLAAWLICFILGTCIVVPLTLLAIKFLGFWMGMIGLIVACLVLLYIQMFWGLD